MNMEFTCEFCGDKFLRRPVFIEKTTFKRHCCRKPACKSELAKWIKEQKANEEKVPYYKRANRKYINKLKALREKVIEKGKKKK
jgi:hypothetical protein